MQIARPVRLALLLAACVGVLALALMPLQTIPEVGVSDKIEHTLAFAVLAVLGTWSFPGRTGRVAAGLIGFGILIEILQGTLPLGRDAEVLDVAADSIGVALGMAAELLILRGRL
ncbi:MAG: VanZ family protein [Ignavibacteriales bacterium]